MNLRNQQRKAMVLSVLMVMLAQSAYSQYYQGWYPPVYLEESPEVSYVNPVTCASETRTAGTVIYVDEVYGDDSYAGTSTCPMKTLSGAVGDAVSNDEIVMQSGLYHDNVSIDGIDNLEIRAATGATVIFDGTRSITEDLGGVWGSADSDGIQEVTLTQDGWQLFLAHEEQVPARWPNAQFSDETVFNRSYMAEGTLTNSNNAYTVGWLTDAGPEAGVHTGLNETINATGLDPVGAIAVMNLGSFRSNSREITGWNPSNGTFSYDGTGVGWKSKHHAYFLEGKRELIDADGEWWYNNTDNTLHYKTPTSQDANDLDLRVKVQPFAISVDNSDGVTIQGIDFFGTTVNFNNCDGCSFTNSTLQYPSTSKRGLGIAGESEDDRWMTRFYRCKNTFVDKISITNTDGGALEFHGSGGQSHNNTVNNSYFHAIDWSAADQKGLMTTIYEGGRDMYFTNNSVHLTGASSVLSIGDAPQVFYNRVWDVGHLQTDGAVVQVMQGEAPGAEIAYNWIHDVIKYGARFDAPIGQAGEGRNGTMHHNVIWNAAGGLMVKGDYHDIHNNTVFNSSGKNDIIFLTDGGINNKNSTLHNNAVDAMADHRSGDVFANPLPNGSHWNNWNGYLQGYDGMFEARNQISCAIYDNGSLYCWGRNDHGQLGLGSTSVREDAPQFVDFGTGRTVNSLGMGSSGAEGWEPNSHTCAVLDNGSLMCWGANGDGQLGIGNVSANGVWEPTFVNVGSGLTVISVATASSSSCALLSNQSVKCWGRNNFGQLGLGNVSNNDVLTPHYVNFIGSSKPVSLHAGMNSYCAQLDNGSIACWGRNIDGELGLGNTTNQNTPVTLSIPAGRTVSTVSLGKRFMCLSYDNGSVACVGLNDENQLGQGGVGVSQSSLSYVNGIEMMVQRVDSAQEVACAHLVNGSVVCWGEDEWGLFGNSSSSYTSRTASTATEYVNFGTDRIAASISVSMRHSCAVLDNGDLACWGRNHKSQLGLGNMTQQFTPVVVSNVSIIRQVQIHEMLVDPANEDFRPKWGSHLQQLSAGAYDAGDSNPWTAGISWTYSSPSAPVAGCMLDYADNYDSDAIVSDGSCTFSSYTPSSSLDLRLHVDPANIGSYSGSGTDLVDLSTYSNDGTIDGAAWEANRTRFYYDGSCSGATAPANQAGTYVCDEVTFAETNDHDPDANGDWSVSVWMNATTVQHSVIIGKWNGGGSASDLGYIIRIGSDNKLYTSVGTTSGSSAVSTSRISIDEDRWYHLVMVADAGNILRLYADGVNVVNASLSGSGSIRNTTSGISIGSYNAGEYNQPFDGNIGEVMIFADALNSTTINQMYNASKGAYSNTTSLSYSDSSYTFVKGQPYNLPLGVSNGDVTTSYTLAGSLPSGMNFGSSNGTIWGTPTADMSSATYTVTANNSAGSFSTTITLTVNDVPPSITYSASSLSLLKGAQMSALAVTNSGGSIVSCSVSPSLPNGMSLSSTCELSGTPTVASTNASYTITATNTAGSDSTSIYIEVLNSGGTLTVTPTHSTGSVNATLASIAASYSHSLTIPSWTSSVTNTSVKINNSGSVAGTAIAAWDNGDLVIAWTRPIYGGTTQHVLAISVYDGNSWTTQDIDTASRTGYCPSIAIDSQGALHIAYLDRDNTNLRYATNASGSWVLSTLDNSSVNPNNVAAKTGIAIDNRGHVHIIHPVQGSGVWVLNYTTNVSGSFVSTTITDTTKDDGKYASLAIAGNGSLHISVYRDNGGSDLRYYTDESGVWTNETVRTGSNFGKDSAIALNSKDEVVIVYRRDDGSDDIYMSVGNRGSWTSSQVASNRNAMYLAVAIDSNDDVHISSHNSGGSSKDLEYFTNSSGSWVRTTLDAGVGGIFGSIVIDSNDDVHIAHADTIGANDLQYATAKGSGKGLAVNPVFSVSPSLPDGLILNWKTGEITGTPTVASTNTTYTLTALALGVTTTATFTLHVTGAPGDISYNDILGTNGVAITPALPTITTNGTTGGVTTWAINASLPTGLTFESSNGTIWGTPTQIIAGAVFTIWANNSGGSTVAYLNITVIDQVPTLSYSPSTLVLTKNNQSSDLPLSATLTGSGDITSWVINATLPAGLNFGTSNGTIWGIPTVSQATATTYTIWANNSGGSTSATITITINDEPPGPFEYIPENNTWTNNSYVNIGPSFINITTGNNSNWLGSQVRSGSINIGLYVEFVVNDLIYFDESYGGGHLYAYNTSNNTAWRVFETMESQTVYDVGEAMSMIAGDIIYFSGDIWSGGSEKTHLYAHNTSNGTTWRVPNTSTYHQGVNLGTEGVVLDDNIYFAANTGGGNLQVWGYNSVNNTAWQATSTSHGFGCCSNLQIVGDTIYYTANRELWAYNTSNQSDWEVAEINPHHYFTSDPGRHMSLLVGDTMYFDADDGSTGRELWAYNTSNETYWRVVDISNGPGASNPGSTANILVGDTIYFNAYDSNTGYTEMWAHTTSNVTTWKVTDLNSQTGYGNPSIGVGLIGDPVVIGDTIFFDAIARDSSSAYKKELWAHDTSNHSTWQVSNLSGPSSSNQIGSYVFLGLGDTLYFSNTHSSNFWLWAYDTTNQSVWNTSIRPGDSLSVVVGNTIYLEGSLPISNSFRLIAHQPGSVNHQTNTGGNVTTWTINGSLPSGVTFNIQTGVLSGTPTELWPQTSYMVWANNSGGSSVAYLNITVVDELPTLSYTPENLTLTKGQTSTDLPLNSTLSGSGTITSWAISPALPSGLSFGTSNGTIWGTPTSLMTLKTFTIWANNSGGSSSATVNITVNDEAPDISYNPDWFVLTNNTAMSPPATPTNSGGAVPSTVIDSTGQVGYYTSIAIDSNGYKHISYYDSTNGDLKYATDKTGSWVDISVDTTGIVGIWTSIAIDSNDAVHISYYDTTNGGLKYATCSSGCTTASNWDDVTVDTAGDVGSYSSIAIDSNDAVHISYFDKIVNSALQPVGDLKYATCSSTCTTASNWDKVSVDTTGDVGRHSSIAIDSNDAVHISYHDHTNMDLKYATCSSGCTTASNWDDVSVDTTGIVGHWISIAIDSNDAVHISYYDTTNVDLKYATCSSGCTSASNWDDVSVDTTGMVGIQTSIAIDSNDAVHISYFDITNVDLKYATCSSGCTTASNWDNVSVDTTGDVGRYSSIAIDSNDAVHISYLDYTNRDLKYIVLDSSSNIYGYSVSPDLPAGLSLNAFTGEISGTPTELSTNTTYTITVWNTGGSNTTTITIEVIDQLPSISYSPDNLNLTNNTVSSDLPLAPTITGPGDITSWEINATLPSGINFGSDNGTLWGIPTELWPQASYMVWANNSGGTTIAYLNITVIDQLSTISYSPADLILTNNTNSTDLPLAPTITGPGEIVTWEMNGTLPSGISFGNNNGTIWGVPTELWNQTQYMVWANNTGGSAVAYLNITVVDQLPTLSYVPENLTLLNNTQSPSLPLGPTLSGAGIILEWGISDGLPSGLSFGNDNGTIWGIPTERMSRTTFTIWANNSGGSVNASINITVLHQQPLFNYSVLDLMLVNNTVMNNVTSTVTGGEIVSWEVSPDMPDGIAIGADGNISGLPIVVQNRTMYMIWANNTGGSHVVYLNITIYDIIATLDYIPENLTLTRNESMTDLSPTYSGIVDSWEIHPALPDGLNFTNGTISGTPENNMTRSTYTVYANNTGGSISHTINITVLEPVMEFEYIPANVTLVNNTASTDMPMVPILYNDGVAETWEIWPALPSGLNFSSTNGTISGIATELQVIPVNYTIWANNSGGIASTVISITIVDQLPNLTYPGDLELMNNTNSSDLPMLPILDGAGVIVTWEINATLPAGLNFSSENGSIYGIATELWTKTQYTVWANNSGGSSMAMFNVTVVDQVPTDIGYNHEWLVLTRNENNSGILPLTPNLVGPGAITSWEINGTLPTGLNFSSENGTIWGIPTELYHNWQNITIYANNTGGSVVSIIAIMVNDQIPTISYNLSQVVLKNDTEMDSIEAIHGGGPFITLAIHPQLPAGMYFGYDNATIWGQPTELTSKIEYTIWANNSGGSASTTINITVEDNAPVFDYISTEFTFYVDTEMAELPLTVASSGGEIQNFSITPQLPAGLAFGESNGTIWGVATQDIAKTTFTISAYNPLGVYSVDIDIAVYDYVYGFELDPIWVANDSFMQPIKPTYIIPGATYSVDPDLPEGMSVNPNTGVVSGRPNSTMQLTSYTLIASVDGYTLSVPMKLGMLEDTDLDGMPDEIPPGGNALGITEDLDDDNDKVDDLTEIDCDTDPLDAEDKPKFNSNGNCAPEPAGIGFLWCLPMILLLLLLMVLIIAIKKKDDPGVVSANNTKPSEKKKGREKWMQDYRIDDDEVE